MKLHLCPECQKGNHLFCWLTVQSCPAGSYGGSKCTCPCKRSSQYNSPSTFDGFLAGIKKPDKRPALGLWAPGGYLCECVTCKSRYTGDKRSVECADCAYSRQQTNQMNTTKPEPLPPIPLEQSHAEMVSGVTKGGERILNELTPQRCDLWHAATGIAGEAGELLDAIKKHVVYSAELDRENIIEELGDLEFYMQRLRSALFITREETLEANIEKLAKRYPGFHFSNQAAQDRADKTTNQ